MTTNTDENTAPPDAAALMRMVDFRIPLPWLLGGFIVAIGSLIGMYYQLQAVSEKLVALQIDVKAGNSSYATLAGEMALLKFRVEGLESDRRAVQSVRPR